LSILSSEGLYVFSNVLSQCPVPQYLKEHLDSIHKADAGESEAKFRNIIKNIEYSVMLGQLQLGGFLRNSPRLVGSQFAICL
jgi:hypothetical protein